MKFDMKDNASMLVLTLDDGSKFFGWSCGAVAEVSAELSYDTSMIGYPEALVDKDHAGKILLMTYPQIGNYGVCLEDLKGQKPQIAALIVHDMCNTPSSHRCDMALGEYLREHGIVAMEGIDTRALMQLIRDGLVHSGTISIDRPVIVGEDLNA